MNCSSAEAHFERFLDAELTAAQTTRMLDHVDRCATCSSVLEELRVVDALLLAPRQVELAPNFTFATMAEARALAPATPYRAPVGAYVVSYLAGAWMLVGAAFVFEPHTMHAVTAAALAIGRSIADAVGGLGSMVSRAIGHGVYDGRRVARRAAGARRDARGGIRCRAELCAARLGCPATFLMSPARTLGMLLAVLIACAPPAAWAHAHDGSVTTFFSDKTVDPDETIDGDLNVVFGNATVAGHVLGNVNVIGGSCRVLDSGTVDGDEHCAWNDATQALAPLVASSAGIDRLAEADRRLFVKLASSAIVVLVFLLFPLRMRLALDRVERHPGIAAAVGVATCLAIIPVALLLVMSIVGIPLILVEVAALFAGVWLGTGAIALLVGRRLCELVMPRSTPSPFVALVLGLVVVCAAEVVPHVGWAVTALVSLVGLGAAVLAFVRTLPGGRLTVGSAVSGRPIGGPPMTMAP